MTATQTQTNTSEKSETTEAVSSAPSQTEKRKPESEKSSNGSHNNDQRQKNDRRNQRDKKRNNRRGGERAKPEFDHTVVDIRRVTRVMAGGRRFSFRVTVVAGDRKGRIGVGTGKSMDTPTAIDKAFRAAQSRMITVQRTQDGSIPCESEAKYCGSHVLMLPSPGRGVIAGSSVRSVLELAGVNDVSTKLISRSKNQLNNAKAAIQALAQLPTPTGEDADTEKT